MNDPIVELGERAAEGVDKVAETPPIVFKKKTWRHREQELNFKKRIRSLIAENRPLFVVEPLPEDDRLWFTGKDGAVYIKRCAICWEPATLVEQCVDDSTYHRWLCQDHQHK